MAETPAWVMAVFYWLHMLATVVWLGGLSALSLLVLPAARRILTQTNYATFLLHLQARLQRVGWFALGVLTVTGMFQMSDSPQYEGVVAVTSPWAWAILFKHLAIGVMTLLSAVMTWGVLPALQRLALLAQVGKSVDEDKLRVLIRQETWLMRLNLLAAALVLLLTAWARIN